MARRSAPRVVSLIAVFLANVTDFTDASLNAFADYLKRGGGLVFFLGDNVQPAHYNNVLSRKFNFLPATLGDIQGDASKDDQFVLLQDKNFEHPIARLWNDPASSGTVRRVASVTRASVPSEPTSRRARSIPEAVDAGPRA